MAHLPTHVGLDERGGSAETCECTRLAYLADGSETALKIPSSRPFGHEASWYSPAMLVEATPGARAGASVTLTLNCSRAEQRALASRRSLAPIHAAVRRHHHIPDVARTHTEGNAGL